MKKILPGILALIVISTLILNSFAKSDSLSPSVLTNESASSLLSKGDKLYEEANQTHKIESWILTDDAYFRAWLQADENTLYMASYKYAATRLEIGDHYLNNDKNLKGALNSYFCALALATYPNLDYKAPTQSILKTNLQERITQVILKLSPSLRAVDDYILQANKLAQEGYTITALGEYIAAQQLNPNDPRLMQSIQKTLDVVNTHRRELNERRDATWITNDAAERKLIGYLEKRVKGKWSPPEFTREYTGYVMFKVNSDGTLSNITIKESSKNIDFDASMIRAVEKSSPIPAKLLIRAMKGRSYLHVLEKFEYQQKRPTFF
jgi:TonB family protein